MWFGKSPCILSWKGPISVKSLIRPTTSAVVVDWAAAREMSRRRQRGLYSRPLPFWGTRSGICSVGATGPRLTVMLALLDWGVNGHGLGESTL